jgi:hypothetical protein
MHVFLVVRRPIRTWNLLRTFSRHLALPDLLALVSGPFRRKASSRVLPARMVDAGTEEPVRLASRCGGPSAVRAPAP